MFSSGTPFSVSAFRMEATASLTFCCAFSTSLSRALTPREITRDLISLLDTLHQNSELQFLDLVEGRVVNADANPDDEIIEDLEV